MLNRGFVKYDVQITFKITAEGLQVTAKTILRSKLEITVGKEYSVNISYQDLIAKLTVLKLNYISRVSCIKANELVDCN